MYKEPRRAALRSESAKDIHSNNPIHYIEMAYDLKQLIVQPNRETIKTSTTLDVILVSHTDLHKNNGVMKYNISDHYLVYTELELNHNDVKKVYHNSVKFRDMKIFNPESFIDDLNSCEMFNGSICENDISWDKWRHNFTEICNKNAPIKVARLKKRSNPWVTPDVVKLMYERDHVHAKVMKTKDDRLYNHYRSLRNHVTKVIQENKSKYYKEINSLCANDPKKMWSEIKRLVSSKRTPNVINCDISPDRFNRHFVNITKNQNRNFINEPDDFFMEMPIKYLCV